MAEVGDGRAKDDGDGRERWRPGKTVRADPNHRPAGLDLNRLEAFIASSRARMGRVTDRQQKWALGRQRE